MRFCWVYPSFWGLTQNDVTISLSSPPPFTFGRWLEPLICFFNAVINTLGFLAPFLKLCFPVWACGCLPPGGWPPGSFVPSSVTLVPLHSAPSVQRSSQPACPEVFFLNSKQLFLCFCLGPFFALNLPSLSYFINEAQNPSKREPWLLRCHMMSLVGLPGFLITLLSVSKLFDSQRKQTRPCTPDYLNPFS